MTSPTGTTVRWKRPYSLVREPRVYILIGAGNTPAVAYKIAPISLGFSSYIGDRKSYERGRDRVSLRLQQEYISKSNNNQHLLEDVLAMHRELQQSAEPL